MNIKPTDIMHYPLKGDNALQVLSDGVPCTIYRMDINNNVIEPLKAPFPNPLQLKALLRKLENIDKPIVFNNEVVIPLQAIGYTLTNEPGSKQYEMLINLLISEIKQSKLPLHKMQTLWNMRFDTTGLFEAGKALCFDKYGRK